MYGFRIQFKQQSISKPTREINLKKADEENRYFIQLYDQGAGLVPGLLLTPFPVQTVQAGPATRDRGQETEDQWGTEDSLLRGYAKILNLSCSLGKFDPAI